MTDKEIGKIAFDKFGLQECDEEYTYFILGYKEAQAKQLRIGVVSSMFSAKQMEQAFNDGIKSEQQRCGEFDIENYC